MTERPPKVLSLAEAAALAGRLRGQGQTVVVANGAFDLLHVGHVRYLAAARQLGDVLFVAVNSDVSVRNSKGPHRPVVPQDERVEMLGHLVSVDHLVLFEEDTVTEVLRALRPHVHAKGTDYTRENLPERGIVAEWGGRTAICGDPKNHGTSDLVAEILRRFGAGHPLPA